MLLQDSVQEGIKKKKKTSNRESIFIHNLEHDHSHGSI
jgi:hypothetical protein